MYETKLYFGNDFSIPVYFPTDVRENLPPDEQYKFKLGHSMALAAEAWVNAKGKVPNLIANVVGSNDLVSAHFEYEIRVYGRGASMTDIMAFTADAVIAVEAKAGEPLDDLVADWIDKEQARNVRSPPHRCTVIARYARAFEVRFSDLLPLRYQLFRRTLSAALAAQRTGRKRAWMVVQSFARIGSDGHRQNRADFDRFVGVVGGEPVLEKIPVRLAWVNEPVAEKAAE